MCLYIDHQITNSKKMDTEPQIFFKVFLKKEDQSKKKYLETPFLHYKVDREGLHEVALTDKYSDTDIGSGAFHARTKETSIGQELSWIKQFELGKYAVVKIHVKAKDIIAYGNQDDVAVKAYEITSEDWKKILTSW